MSSYPYLLAAFIASKKRLFYEPLCTPLTLSLRIVSSLIVPWGSSISLMSSSSQVFGIWPTKSLMSPLWLAALAAAANVSSSCSMATGASSYLLGPTRRLFSKREGETWRRKKSTSTLYTPIHTRKISKFHTSRAFFVKLERSGAKIYNIIIIIPHIIKILFYFNEYRKFKMLF